MWTGAWAHDSEAALPEEARTVSRTIAADGIRKISRICSEQAEPHAANETTGEYARSAKCAAQKELTRLRYSAVFF